MANSFKDIHPFLTLIPLLFKACFKFWPPATASRDLKPEDEV
jgi:hypothetical protein